MKDFKNLDILTKAPHSICRAKTLVRHESFVGVVPLKKRKRNHSQYFVRVEVKMPPGLR